MDFCSKDVYNQFKSEYRSNFLDPSLLFFRQPKMQRACDDCGIVRYNHSSWAVSLTSFDGRLTYVCKGCKDVLSKDMVRKEAGEWKALFYSTLVDSLPVIRKCTLEDLWYFSAMSADIDARGGMFVVFYQFESGLPALTKPIKDLFRDAKEGSWSVWTSFTSAHSRVDWSYHSQLQYIGFDGTQTVGFRLDRIREACRKAVGAFEQKNGVPKYYTPRPFDVSETWTPERASEREALIKSLELIPIGDSNRYQPLPLELSKLISLFEYGILAGDAMKAFHEAKEKLESAVRALTLAKEALAVVSKTLEHNQAAEGTRTIANRWADTLNH